ncbi:periplasmic heavy metal sensor [Pragia fontium]|uniref:periplasmic heavy metal sensor n=1 Tax=Pragia fontium TaxID=82985 RepID=UPI000F6EE4EA|nr:periplasmic heavy metal sensor [Pragia fontium]VEJ53567.1 Zinc resistance-associated protein precursor [Pragia fontium]
MTLNKTAIAAIISLAALTGFGGVAMAQNETTGHMNMNGQAMPNAQGMNHSKGNHRGGYMANMTPEQQATSQKAFDEFQTKTADLRQQMMSKQYEYKALLTSKTVDDKKVQAVSQEISALRDSIYQQRVAMDTQLAKSGIPMAGRHMGMGMGDHQGMGGKGMHSGRGCR